MSKCPVGIARLNDDQLSMAISLWRKGIKLNVLLNWQYNWFDNKIKRGMGGCFR